MTDERKPETPGLAEVSPKFVDEAEAAVEAAASTDEALAALWQEWQRLWEANKKAVEEAQDDKLASETFTALMAVEKRMEDMPARTAAGVWNKLQVAGVWIDTNRGSPDEDKMGVVERLTLSALADLERMSQGIAPSTIKEPVIDEPLLALERRWRAAVKAHEEAGIDTEEERLTESLEAQKKILTTPARSVAGVLVKLHVYAGWDAKTDGPPIDEQSIGNFDFDTAAVWGAMFDLERLARTTPVAKIPPAEDAALFDALAEYDRLAIISHDLEHQSDILRSGTPEAADASEAFQAAYKKTMKAWETARDTPVATQAGLFAKLRATVRFMYMLVHGCGSAGRCWA